jgi:hypothetical protein
MLYYLLFSLHSAEELQIATSDSDLRLDGITYDSSNEECGRIDQQLHSALAATIQANASPDALVSWMIGSVVASKYGLPISSYSDSAFLSGV